jgi:hypothetical protein
MATMAEQFELGLRQVSKYNSHSNDRNLFEAKDRSLPLADWSKSHAIFRTPDFSTG